jgi:hypothetical protein
MRASVMGKYDREMMSSEIRVVIVSDSAGL